MRQLLEKNQLVLTEAAVVEKLRRSDAVCLHETLANAPLIYDPPAAHIMGRLYLEYMDLAVGAGLPMLVCTPTWRASKSRVADAGVSPRINQDSAAYLKELREAGGYSDGLIRIGGLLGCKNDCYQPAEALSVSDAEQFHHWQIEQLVDGGVDFLMAETLPNVHEALGIAKAMEPFGLPYIISFVISRNGRVLDGYRLDEAADLIDTSTKCQPLGYMVNCAHPTFLCPERQPSHLFDRLIGYQANASSLDHCDLDKADVLKIDDLEEWGQLMLNLNTKYGIRILGGCCGTGREHLEYLIRNR